jgi:hypothetical protein
VLAIYKVAAVPILLHGSEPYTVKIKDWTRIQKAEMKSVWPMKDCSKMDGIRNEGIRTEMVNFLGWKIKQRKVESSLPKNGWDPHA